MTADAESLTSLLSEFGGLWKISRTQRGGFVAQRRPLPAPPLVLTADTAPAFRELLARGYDTAKLTAIMRDFGSGWDVERVDPGSAWIAVSLLDGTMPRVVAAADLDSLRRRLSGAAAKPGG
jgi:hypothetical protein